MKREVIIALDYPNAAQALGFLAQFREERPFVKVGMELYYAEGPDLVRQLKEQGHPVFLDLKLHDIPNTVASATRALRGLGVDLLNLHAGGGLVMMRAAVDALRDTAGPVPKLLAVTILTSLNDQMLQQELRIAHSLRDTVLHYASLAREAGLDGVVCSPHEAPAVHERLGVNFLTVTPGVRFATDEAGDQQRVTTPEMARELGSDYIVVGRPITRATDPKEAYRRCLREFAHR